MAVTSYCSMWFCIQRLSSGAFIRRNISLCDHNFMILAGVTNLLLLLTLVSLSFSCRSPLHLGDASVMSRTSQKRSGAQSSN